MKKISIYLVVCTFVALSLPPLMGNADMDGEGPQLLDPETIPKYENQITAPPPVYVPKEVRGKDGEIAGHRYNVRMMEFRQQILPPGYPDTSVWGYGGLARDSVTGKPLGFVKNSPGPTFEATRGIPSQVTWRNMIHSEHIFPVDPTLHWADPNGISMVEPPFEPYPPGYPDAQEPVPLIPHLHGGEVQSTSDGNPDSWFTSDGIHGPAYNTEMRSSPNSAVFEYPNAQPPTTLWYHDHALGVTRLNVMSGLAGFYLLRDPQDGVGHLLPQGIYEMPVVIQDRIFLENGEMYFPSEGNNPDIHPYWGPEFFGDSIMVNGLVWPNMDVHQGQYRLRLLDGSNARFYTLSFQVKIGEDDMGNPMAYGEELPFTQIGSDGGYLRSAFHLNELTIAPGERMDILIDFSGLEPGTKVILRNSAYAPYKGGEPGGDPADPETVGQIMQFTMMDEPGFGAQNLPEQLNQYLPGDWPTLTEVDNERTLVLVEVMSPEDEPEEILLNGQKWGADITEMPHLGSTEEWIIVNPTEDTHPIHLHLTQFQLLRRQWLGNPEEYYDDWLGENSPYEPPFPNWYSPSELPVDDYLSGDPMMAPYNERGWKDTIQAHPGQATVIRVRFSPIDGNPDYPFDATEGPGYVWHCHILDHEDNEMMRPFVVMD